MSRSRWSSTPPRRREVRRRRPCGGSVAPGSACAPRSLVRRRSRRQRRRDRGFACRSSMHARPGPACDKGTGGRGDRRDRVRRPPSAQRRDPHVSVIPAGGGLAARGASGCCAPRERELAGPLEAACTLALNEGVGPGRAAAETTFDSGALAAFFMPPAILKNQAACLAGLSVPLPWPAAPGTDSSPRQSLRDRLLAGLSRCARQARHARQRAASRAALESACSMSEILRRCRGLTRRVETLTPVSAGGETPTASPPESRPRRHRPTRAQPPRPKGAGGEVDRVVPRSTHHPERSASRPACWLQVRRAGVDSTMVLPINAGEDDRVRLRQLYAQAWGFAATDDRLHLLDQWRAEVKRRVDPPKNGTSVSRDPVLRLYDTVALVRLNQAAYAIFAGEFAGVEAARTARPRDPGGIPCRRVAPGLGVRAGASGRSARSTGISSMGQRNAGTSDGVWAEKFLTAERSIPLRLESARQFDQGAATARPPMPRPSSKRRAPACRSRCSSRPRNWCSRRSTSPRSSRVFCR